MKNFIKVTVIAVIFTSSLFSCNPEKVTEDDIEIERFEKQSIEGEGDVREKPTSD